MTISTLAELLAARALTTPAKVALRFEGDALSYRELDERAERLASGLSELGVSRGDPVCVLLDTSCDYAAVWLALTRLGAIEAPINAGFRGPALAHALRLTGARVLILDGAHADAFAQVQDDVPSLRHVVWGGAMAASARFPGKTITPFEVLLQAAPGLPAAPGKPGDTTMLLFTSGSTGPSKACAIPHGYVLRQPAIFCEQLGLGPDDVLYAPFPLFHADGAIFTLAAALSCGGTAALAPRFSASKFWDDCRRHGATAFDFMGATLAMLYKQPPSRRDREHDLRFGWGVPAPPFAEDFSRRFGVALYEVYGLSDAGIVLYNTPSAETRTGSCGRPARQFDVRLQDEAGAEVGPGKVGEIVIRGREPHLIMNGYFGDDAATAAAFRDGWFHTGDLARRDEDGFFYFVARLKDIIRRRGENISAFDVEQALLTHPDIVEAAAYGVPSEMTEEDLMVAVVPRAGSALTTRDVIDWAAHRLARHMVPRYVRLATQLPRTETEKTAKFQLKAEGVTPDAVDFDNRADASAKTNGNHESQTKHA